MAKSKILVTGGSGYVGSRVTTELLKRNFNVVVADEGAPEQRKINFPKKVEIRLGDLRDSKVASKAVSGIETVVHLAANIGPITYMHEHQAEILRDNTAINATLYPAMVEAGVKTVVYSSSSMVFQKSPIYPYKETDLAKVNPPTNVYGLSKLVGEYFCRSFHEQHSLNYVIMRYHNIYGAGEDSKGSTPGDIHVIPALVEKVLSGQYPLELLGNPEATRPFTYVDDAVEATVRLVEEAIAENPKVLNTDFNIGPREATRILDLAELIWEILGDGRPFKYKVKTTKAVTADRREMDPEKIERVIGWKPKMPLEEGIKIVADWIRERGVNPVTR